MHWLCKRLCGVIMHKKNKVAHNRAVWTTLVKEGRGYGSSQAKVRISMVHGNWRYVLWWLKACEEWLEPLTIASEMPKQDDKASLF